MQEWIVKFWGGWMFWSERARTLCLAAGHTPAWSKQTWRRGMQLSWQLFPRCAALVVCPDYTHWPYRKCETDGGEASKTGRSGWMGSLFGRRREEGALVLVRGRRPAAFSVYINVFILNWLWGSQRLWKNGWERNRKQRNRKVEL